MYKFKKFFCVIALFSVFLSFSISSIAFADENYNIDVPFTLEDFDSFDEYTQAINMYLNPDDYISPAGTVDSGELGTENVNVRIYAGLYANWYTEENFSSSADLAYTKTFSIPSIESNLKYVPASSARNPGSFLYSYFKPLFGYTCTFNLKEGETVNGGVVDFDLDFSGDTAYSVNNYACQATWSSSSFSSVSSKIPTTNWPNITNIFGSMTSLIGKEGYSYLSSGSGNSVFVGAMHNTLSFIGITSDGSSVDLSSYTDTTGGKYRVKLPDDVEFKSLVFDMEYFYSDSSNFVSPGSGYTNYYFPYMFKANFSGSIKFDQNSVISGLISSIIQWLKQILNAILSLPQKIADLVIDGLKTLFVPSADDLQPKFNEFKTAAYSKLGFVYQVAIDFIDLLQELFNATVSPTTTLTIPQIALPWDKVDGGQMILLQETTFNVFPENLEGLRTLCKTITSMVLVLAFYRSVLSAFEKFFKE